MHRGTGFKLLLCIYTTVSSAQAPDHLSMARAAVELGDLERATIVLTEALSRRPADSEARFLRARVLSWQDRWEQSLADYEWLLRSEPAHVDYLLGKAQVLLWSGQSEEAAAVAGEARRVAPDYQASYRLELDALLASDAQGARDEAEALAALARNRFPRERFDLPPPASGVGEISVGMSHESLTAGFENWQSYYVNGAFYLGGSRSVSAGFRSSERFGIEDQELSAGGNLRLNARWTMAGTLTLGPDARVLPRSSISLSAHRTIAPGWSVDFGLRHSDYQSTYSDVLFAGIERYWHSYRFSYRLYRGEAEAAEATISHVMRGDLYYAERSSIGLLVAGGEESENIGGAQLVNTDVTSISLMGQHEIGSDWYILWSVGHHEQGNLYDRKGIDIAVRYRY